MRITVLKKLKFKETERLTSEPEKQNVEYL